jgi:putative Ca2+/H+ antiporter (TMEM165/GDT1 family)
MDALALSFGVILLAELGDKSQLIAVAFAARYRARVVFAGIVLATLLINALSVALGAAFAAALPTRAILLVGGLIFLGFAAWTIWRDGAASVEDAAPKRTDRLALLAVGGAYLVAEFGDKTMLATITLAATGQPLAVWLGASAAMITANAIAIVLAVLIGKRLPQRAMQYFAALAFLVFGALLIAEGLGLV